jgi:hypothetical protein
MLSSWRRTLDVVIRASRLEIRVLRHIYLDAYSDEVYSSHRDIRWVRAPRNVERPRRTTGHNAGIARARAAE